MGDAAALPPIPLFSELSPPEVGALVAMAHILELEGGRLVFAEGDAGRELYVVLSGTVTASGSLPDGTVRTVASFFPGDFFGEMGIFEGRPRSAACRTDTRTRLLCVTERELRRFAAESPAAAVRLLRALGAIVTRRLREKSGLLASMVAWGEQAARRAFTDDTTGAYNRRYLDQALADCCETARRQGTSVSLAMADVDDFRRINESLTQTTGDAILREITDVVSRHLRDEDALARYGGDELALVLPDRTPEEALELSRRICRAVAAHPRWAEMRLALSVTISLGCATTAGPEADAATLTRRADDALYRAKRAGKNAVAGG